MTFDQLLHSDICSRAAAAALDEYPAHEDDWVNMFADSAKVQLAEKLHYRPIYIPSASSSEVRLPPMTGGRLVYQMLLVELHCSSSDVQTSST